MEVQAASTASSRKDGHYYKGKSSNCPKTLHICEGGKDRRVSAKTRSWEQAERLAQHERDRRGPVKRMLQEIEEQEAQRISLRKEKNITVKEAADQGVLNLSDVTTAKLGLWRGDWNKGGKKKDNRIGQTSQSQFQFQGYLKRFFRWSVWTGLLTISFKK
jgi:hypothetical protein